jgi:hypothetical protein
MDFQRWWAETGHQMRREKFSTSEIARAAWEAATKAEREACAKICEDYAEEAWDIERGALGCADRIRARSLAR